MNWTNNIGSYRFKFFSQCGEEGFITNIMNKTGGWQEGLIVDLGAWDGEHLSNTKYYEQCGIAKRVLIDSDNRGASDVHEHFITKDNICELLNKYEVPEEFDLLSIDLDGNDADILEAILKQFKPRVIVSEFNAALTGCVKIKYDPEYVWDNTDYYGYSFEYGQSIAREFGYRIVFQNDNLNMYYVREDLLEKGLPLDVSYSVTPYFKHKEGEWVTKQMEWEGNPFNGDTYLADSFRKLRDTYNIDTVIETGTYKGDTTLWFNDNFKNVYTIELQRDIYTEAAKRLLKTNVHNLFGDSAELLSDILNACKNTPILFLDAHWYANPMAGEFMQIKKSGKKPILVIHDFENPEHPEFQFDSYPDQRYNLQAIKPYLDGIYDNYEYYYNKEAAGAKVGCLFVIPITVTK